MKVSVILQRKGTEDVAWIAPGAPLGDAVRTLAEHRIGALVVSPDGGKIDGIVSERDIVRRLGLEGPEILLRPVSEIMTRSVETCEPGDIAIEILQRMTRGRFRHMPVTERDGRMVGILSIGDVVAARLEEIEAENSAMSDMLSG